MKKKFILLFLALALPALVFVFLKRFGKNEFNLPVYFQTVDSVNTACGTRYTAPYRVPDSVLEKTGWHAGRPTLFVLDTAVDTHSEFSRLADIFETTEVQAIGINPFKFDSITFRRWYSCVLMVKPPSDVVLVDSEKKIRGYYSIGSREETDRLIVELKILLKKY